MRVALFGLGEAGSCFAADLVAAGVEVHGFDPAEVPTPPGVVRHASPADAVAGADVVMAVTAAADAGRALEQALDDIPATAVYADLSTASAGLKQRLDSVAAGAGLAFVDVALMSPVPGRGLRTPALASGRGAAQFVEHLGRLGMNVEYDGDEAGRSATRKLLRSIVIKGLAGLIAEAVDAASAAGLADETWANLVGQFEVADDAFLRRLVEGSVPHARRRLHEMEAAVELLHELGVDPVMTRSTVESLRRIHGGGALPELPPPAGAGSAGK